MLHPLLYNLFKISISGKYRKYQKYLKYQKYHDIFDIFENTIFPTLQLVWSARYSD